MKSAVPGFNDLNVSIIGDFSGLERVNLRATVSAVVLVCDWDPNAPKIGHGAEAVERDISYPAIADSI